jgi:very-short-patch-repair endonuclease
MQHLSGTLFAMPGTQLKAMTDVMRLAKRHHECFTAAQARDAGVSPRFLTALTHAGVVSRLFQGVYAVGGVPSVDQRMMAACLATGGRVSHWSAAHLWGFDVSAPSPVHVLLARRGGSRRDHGLVIHRTLAHVVGATHRGIPVTIPARTLVDVASLAVNHADEEAVVCLVGFFVSKRLLQLSRLEQALDRQAGGLPGTLHLRSLIAEMAGPTESVAELELVRLLEAAGLPRPKLQFEARTARGELIGRLDAAYPELRIAMEVDGYRFHADYDSFVADHERHNRLVADGWTVLRMTLASIRSSPRKVVADVRAALDRVRAA